MYSVLQIIVCLFHLIIVLSVVLRIPLLSLTFKFNLETYM